MAQLKLEHPYKHRKVTRIASLPPRENKKKMTSTAIPRSPQRNSTSSIDQKDRQQQLHQQQSDSASVASTVKISNVASPSPLPKTTHDDGRAIPTSIRPSKIKAILDSRDDNQYSGIGQRLYNHTDSYQSDLLIAPTTSDMATEHATIVMAESFLLHTLEGVTPNEYMRIVTDRIHIPPNLQIQLAGDRSQSFTVARLRPIWNDLTIDDYQCISNSCFHHMRFSEKHQFHAHLKMMKGFWNGCRFSRRRCSRQNAHQTTSSNNVSTSSTSESVNSLNRPPASMIIVEEQVNNNYQRYIDVSANNTITSSNSQPQEAVEIETKPAPLPSVQTTPSASPTSTFELITGVVATTTVTTLQPDETPNQSTDGDFNIPLTTTPSQSQQQDPILVLLDIVDNSSVNSSSTNGYATSMTSSIGSSSNMSRNHRYYNRNNHRNHQQYRIPVNHRQMNSHDVTSNYPNSSSMTPITTTSTPTITTTSIIAKTTASWASSSNNNPNSNSSYSSSNTHQSKQHQQQYHHHSHNPSDIDNDSTTSSNTGYISTMSNSHISISGSVASV